MRRTYVLNRLAMVKGKFFKSFKFSIYGPHTASRGMSAL